MKASRKDAGRALQATLVAAGLLLFADAALAQPLDTLLARGEYELGIAQYERAEDAFALATKQFPTSAPAHLGLGRADMARGRYERALRSLKRAESLRPDSLEVWYQLAVANRELARHHTLRAASAWRAADTYFDRILQRDSLYRDAVVQIALAERHRGRWEEALALGLRGVRLRPDLPEVHLAIQRLLQSYTFNQRRETVIDWLDDHPSDYMAWARADLLRREGKYLDALDVLRSLKAGSQVPQAAVHLARARTYYALDSLRQANDLLYRAIDGISNPVDAAILFEDAKYIITPEELIAYRQARRPEEFRAFFRRFWDTRDPLPGMPINYRLAEHYRRLRIAEKDYGYEGLRSWFNNPDRSVELRFPPGYRLNREFNDKGLVFIRFGEPQDRIRTTDIDLADNESWRYRNPDLDFHFMVDGAGGTGNNWRLVPRLTDPRMWSAREEWGGLYPALVRSRSGPELYTLLNRIAERSQKDITAGLQSDRHTWERDIEPIQLPYVLAQFKDYSGTRLEMHFALDPELLREHLPEGIKSADVEVGLALQDSMGRMAAAAMDTISLDIERTGPLAGRLRLASPPGTFNLSIHVRIPETKMLGGYRESITVRDYSQPGLNLSDILPVSEADTNSAGQVKLTGHVQPGYERGKPVRIYYEVYGLTGAESAPPEVEMQLTSRGRGGLFGGGSSRPALTLKAPVAGSEGTSENLTEIDASRVDRGRYDLTIRITQDGQTIERTLPVELEK